MTDVIRPMSGEEWAEANQRDLVQALDRVRILLQRHADGTPGASMPAPARHAAPDAGYALERLGRCFGLSPFELDVVVLCAGVELDGRMADLIAAAQGDPSRRSPTFGLALAMLPDAHWSALAPASPLRAWRLIDVGGASLTAASLRLDERVLHFLAGVNQLDDRLRAILREVATIEPPTENDAVLAQRIAGDLAAGGGSVQITGATRGARLAMVAAAGAALGPTVLLLNDEDIPEHADERQELARLCGREWHLGGAPIAIEVTSERTGERVAAFADDLLAPLLVATRTPVPALADRAPVFEVAARTAGARIAAWQRALEHRAADLNGALTTTAAQFDMEPEAILAVARAIAPDPEGGLRPDALWDACRLASRPRMDGLATRIEAVADWDDLVLPEQQRTVLRTIATHVRHRHLVYEDWGFASRGARGLGISALFVGESGTGKTMAAEVLAREVRLDLYRIDLASVVSKYIGETEKNLRQLFDAAEGSGAILLFDEADALFGKRSEVRDSHDRYANVEVSYLLQRMEAFRGLAILTTNMKQALDPAFMRRIRFMVRFPFPDAELREAIWRGVFPARTPVEALDFERLAQLNVTGGHIRNIALAGAFLAADRGEGVGMVHLADAARAEYGKLERPLSDAETRGWV